MNDKLTITEALELHKTNPQAAALAVGMVLMQNCHEETYRISGWIEKQNKEYIAELENELSYWKPLGKRFLMLKGLLKDEPEGLA